MSTNNRKYEYPYGKRVVNYSDLLTDQIRTQRKATSKEFRERFINNTGSCAVSIGVEALVNSISDLGSLPFHNRNFKMKIPIGKDSIWRRIKDKIGFRDDHTDKNYRT